MFGAGLPWRAYSWLAEVSFAAVERGFGLRGLILFETCAVALFLLSVARCFVSLSRSYLIGIALTLLAALGCFWHLVLRPQALTWILYPVVILLCDQIRTRGFSWGLGAQLAATMCLWANIHVSSVIPLATIALLVERKGLRTLGAALACAFAATLFTPYFGAEWLSAIKYAGHPATFSIITELRPATITEPWSLPLLLSSSLLLVLYYRDSRVLSLRVLLGQLALVLGAFAVMRFIPFAVILTCALLARGLGERPVPLPAALARLNSRLVKRVVAVGLLLSFVPLLALGRGSLKRAFERGTDSNTVARSAVDFIESRSLPQPLLNSFEDGNYLIYRYADRNGEPRYRVPIDGRTEVNTKEAWTEFRAAYLGEERWQDFIDLVKPQTIMWPTGSPFVRILTSSGQWCLVYQEGPVTGTTVLVRRSVWEARKNQLDALNCFE